MEKDTLHRLSIACFGKAPVAFHKLPSNGSQRLYYRLLFDDFSIMGVISPNREETRAFVALAKIMHRHGIPVPEIFYMDSSETAYLCTDLGNASLYEKTVKNPDGTLTEESFSLWAHVLRHLPKIQALPLIEPDIFNVCMHPQSFGFDNVMWDLHYFKYCFLRLTKISFDEWLLENDFKELAQIIEALPLQGFMYRDFNSRNIMIINNNPFFIDFQGGRRGPLQYDPVSFIHQTRAALTENDKERLFSIYLDELENIFPGQRNTFLRDLPFVTLVRLLQVLGAYGYLGLYQRKMQFQKTIPATIRQLADLFAGSDFETQFPELWRVLQQLKSDPRFQSDSTGSQELTIHVTSFSFLNGSYPDDFSGHGGGYVFDCRALPNPGREDQFKPLTGKDPEVIAYLKSKSEVQQFIAQCVDMVRHHAETFRQRGFNRITVNFGCSGGQHRSVFCAEAFAQAMKEAGFNVTVYHREFPNLC